MSDLADRSSSVASRPGSVSGGGFVYAANATSFIVTLLPGTPLTLELVIFPLDVVFGDLEHMRGDLLRLFANPARGKRERAARDRRAAARVRAEAVGRGVGVALFDEQLLRIEAEFLGDDLRPGRLVALTLMTRTGRARCPSPSDGCGSRRCRTS